MLSLLVNISQTTSQTLFVFAVCFLYLPRVVWDLQSFVFAFFMFALKGGPQNCLCLQTLVEQIFRSSFPLANIWQHLKAVHAYIILETNHPHSERFEEEQEREYGDWKVSITLFQNIHK